MKKILVLVLCAVIGFPAFSQNVEKKIVKKEKAVSVDVKKEGDDERAVKIVIDDDGEEKVIEWTDNGEIPEDIRALLDEEGIDVKMLDPGDEEMQIIVEIEDDEDMEGEKMIWVQKGDGDRKDVEEKVYKMVIKGDGGNEKVMEWSGDGEMPAEMKKMMKEHKMELHEGHGKNKMKKKVKMKGGKGLHRGDREMIIVGDDDDHRFRRGEGNVFIFSDDDEGHSTKVSDAYMGAQIGPDDGGDYVVVQEIWKGSPADKAGLAKGDQVHKINGARTKTVSSLMNLLSMFEPNDKIDMTVMREGKERKIQVTLGKRPDHAK